ncbi:MAG: UDP-N-acetylmuramoyl-L-alanyl-D-glutamate--2,6-diaminopimelate ligase [Alphaproteobacteria bacterium]
MAGMPALSAPLGDCDITGLAADSRTVSPGYLFAALPSATRGAATDGRSFIPDAVARGAVAVLAPTGTMLAPELARAVRLVTDDNPRRRLALLAARFHRPQPRRVVAVTGTNGKSSTVGFTRQIWSHLGHKAASLGTLGIEAPGFPAGPSLTTPDPVALHRTLAELQGSGIEHVAIEASSHGLDQYRLDGVVLRAAAFTYIGRDHLDYHGDEAAYVAAKLRLFRELLPPEGTAVLNADAVHFPVFLDACRAAGHDVRSYGHASDDIRIDEVGASGDGIRLVVSLRGRPWETRLPLAGTFQAWNAVAAWALAVASGADPEAAFAALAHLSGVPGRLQLVARSTAGAPVWVDYAHTPDALETVLAAVRPHIAGKLHVVFGAGGDRDPGKRPEMGRVVARLADRAIVTDDNPRREDPLSIRRQILVGCPDAEEIGDRREAIARAIGLLQAGDGLVIAGKGHETGQTVGLRVLPFDDAEVARDTVRALGGEVVA